MTSADEIVPDSERRGFIGALPPRLRPFASLMRIDRPIGTWLLYWPCAWSVALAGVGGRWSLFLWLALGAFAMRSAGCVYNDIVDRDLDKSVERTRLRPLASGRTSVRSAWLLIALLCMIGLLVLMQLNISAAIIASVSIAPVAAYPFMKRITWWPQAWLGLVFSWGALVGWPAVAGALQLPALLLWFGSIAWVIGYDTLYAIQDIEDDALVGVKSSARRLGDKAPQGVALFYAIAVVLWGAAIWAVRPECSRSSHWSRQRCILPTRLFVPTRRTAKARSACSAPTGRPAFSSFSPCWSSGSPAARRLAMLPVERARETAQSLVEQARAAGADAADAIYVGSELQGVQVRLGELEQVDRSEGEEVGLRVFVGQRSASVASSDFSPDVLAELVKRAVAMAREAPEDPFSGLAPADLLSHGDFPDIQSEDQSTDEPDQLRARALAAEGAALAVGGVTNSGGASAGTSAGTMALATSTGFSGAHRSTGHSCSASVIAGEGATMQRDSAWHGVRHLDDLDDPEKIGRLAGERSIAKLNPENRSPAVIPCCSILASRARCSAISSARSVARRSPANPPSCRKSSASRSSAAGCASSMIPFALEVSGRGRSMARDYRCRSPR